MYVRTRPRPNQPGRDIISPRLESTAFNPRDGSSMTPPSPQSQARSRPWRALRLRFLVFVALAVTLVALTVEEVGGQFTRQALEEEGVAAAGAAALGVADDLDGQETLPTAPELDQLLVNYKQLVPTLRSLSVLETRKSALVLIATTTPKPEGDLAALAARSVAKRAPAVETTSRGPDSLRLVAAPLERGGKAYGAVVVGISLSSVARAHDRIRQQQNLLVVASTLLIALLVDLVGQRLVFSPLRALRDTIESALKDERGRRAPIVPVQRAGPAR